MGVYIVNSNVKRLEAENLRELARDNEHLEKLVQFWSDDKLIHHLAARVLELQKPTLKNHYLKISPEHFIPVSESIKTAELRQNDRDFREGDILTLQEWNNGYTGRSVKRLITHIADVAEWLPGYVLLSMR